MTLDEVVAVLHRTPQTLRDLLDGLPERLSQATEGGDSWSPYDVLGHLIHGEKADWIPRLGIILAEGEARPFEPFDRLAQFRESRGKSLAELLDEFEELRASSLQALKRMAEKELDLSLTGTHPDLGRVTAAQLLATWAVHDLGHIAQIVRTMAGVYAEDVGPWRAYLPVLGSDER
jgi:hypothetical protein